MPRFAKSGPPVVVLEGTDNRPNSFIAIWETFAGKRPTDINYLGMGISAIKFTDGTTDKPKGVIQPYRSFLNCIASMLTTFAFDQDERMLCVAPLTHGADTFLLPIFAGGGCNVVLGPAKAPNISDVMLRERITASFMPPTLVFALMDHAKATGTTFPHLRRLIDGAAPMPPARIRQALETFGPRLTAIYGQTEAPTMISAMTAEELRRDQIANRSVARVPTTRCRSLPSAGDRWRLARVARW